MIARRLPGAVSALAMVYGGATAAFFSAAVQAVGARSMSLREQATLALIVSASGAISGIVNAVILEARLADPDIAGPSRTYVPRTAFYGSVAGAVAVVVYPSIYVLAIGLCLSMIGLQLGRTHAVVSRSWKTEAACGSILLLTSGAGVLLSQNFDEIGFRVVFAGVVVAVLIRQHKAWPQRADRTRLKPRVYVGLETAVVAILPFVLNLLVLQMIGSAAAVEFRLILTVLGILQPVLGFLRTRLLAGPSPVLASGLVSLSILALGIVLVANELSVFRAVFSSSWNVAFPVLMVACAWKALSIPATFPFASLRREGRTAVVLTMRVSVILVTIALCASASLVVPTLASIFIALALAECLTFVIYTFAARRFSFRPRATAMERS